MKLVLLAALFAVVNATSAASDICDHPFYRPYYTTRAHFCVPGQRVEDFYTGRFILCEEAEVDHVISLREAYRSGVCGNQLRALANDPENLRLTHWMNNRRKGAARVEQFLSTDNFARSSEAERLAARIRIRYQILERDPAFLKLVSDSIRRFGFRNAAYVGTASMLAGATERRLGDRVLYFSGRRLIGVTTRVAGAASVVILVPDAFEWLARQTSTDSEAARADYIRALLE